MAERVNLPMKSSGALTQSQEQMDRRIGRAMEVVWLIVFVAFTTALMLTEPARNNRYPYGSFIDGVAAGICVCISIFLAFRVLKREWEIGSGP